MAATRPPPAPRSTTPRTATRSAELPVTGRLVPVEGENEGTAVDVAVALVLVLADGDTVTLRLGLAL